MEDEDEFLFEVPSTSYLLPCMRDLLFYLQHMLAIFEIERLPPMLFFPYPIPLCTGAPSRT